MRPDFAAKSSRERLVLISAIRRSTLRQITGLHEIGKHLRIGAIGDAHEVIEPLLRLPMVARERFEGELDLRVLLGAVYVTFPCPCGATHESACAVLAECQHDVGGKIVGGVLLAAQNRDCEHVEHGVPYFVQDKPEELASCCIVAVTPAGLLCIGNDWTMFCSSS